MLSKYFIHNGGEYNYVDLYFIIVFLEEVKFMHKIFLYFLDRAPETFYRIFTAALRYRFLHFLVKGKPTFSKTGSIFGVPYRSPIGMAAGIDVNGTCVEGAEAAGFGFIEIGSLTLNSDEGYRTFNVQRLVCNSSLKFSGYRENQGVVEALKNIKNQNASIPVLLNLSAGTCSGFVKLFKSLEILSRTVDVFVRDTGIPIVKVFSFSCPNKRSYYTTESVIKVLENLDYIKGSFVKIGSEHYSGLKEIIEVCIRKRLGLIIGGQVEGYSGKTIKEINLAYVSQAYLLAGGAIPIIGMGGISNVDDVIDYLCSGATLVAMHTGYILNGWRHIHKLNRKLLKFMKIYGIDDTKSLVGKFVDKHLDGRLSEN